MRIRSLLLLIALFGFVICFTFATLKDQRKEIMKPVIPEGWPAPVYDFKKNPVTRNGFELGRALFYDPLLSRDSSTSCSSCHLQYTNFTHVDHSLSHGIEGRIGTRNSTVIVNAAWNSSFMWDGGANHIEVQPLAPIENPLEMDERLDHIVEKLNRSERYRKAFEKTFGTKSITGQQVLKSLAQYMLMLQSYNSKYDKVMRKEATFTPSEQKGLELFRIHCESCHKEPLFTNNGFENNGLEVDPELKDIGRMKITGKKEDSLKFKVPSLRNIEVSYPYMHDGRFRNLQMVVFHYSHGVDQSSNKSGKVNKAIPMSESEKRDLIAFLKTLTDESFLRDKRFSYAPVP